MYTAYESYDYCNGFPARAARMAGSKPFLFHWHEETELILITDGALDIGVREQLYHLRKGDMLLIAPNVTHCLYASSADSERVAVMFSPELLDAGGRGNGAELLSRVGCCSRDWPEASCQAMQGIILAVFEELATRTPGFEYAVRAQLFRLLTLAKRELPLMGQEAAGSSVDGNAQAILRYIAQHYTGSMSLAACADALGFSMNYLSRLFHRTFDISFSSYVMALRLRQAEWLLRNEPDRPVTEIAYAAGFQSIKTFNRVFKQEHGISPRAYRQQGAPHARADEA